MTIQRRRGRDLAELAACRDRQLVRAGGSWLGGALRLPAEGSGDDATIALVLPVLAKTVPAGARKRASDVDGLIQPGDTLRMERAACFWPWRSGSARAARESSTRPG